SQSQNPACVTITNILEDQYIMYCAPVADVVTLSYTNLITTGSTAYPPTLSTILTVFPTSELESILSAQLADSTITAAGSTSSTLSSSTVSIAPSTITGITGIVTVTTTSVDRTSSTPTSSSTMNSTVSDPSRNSAQASTPLSSGAIAGISIGSAVIGLLAIALVSYFCIRPCLYERAFLRHNRTPRGTLGGATLPGPPLPVETYEAPRRYVNVPQEYSNDMNFAHQQMQHNISMTTYRNQTTPWNASRVGGDGRSPGIAELHGETRIPVYHEAQPARLLLGNHNSNPQAAPHDMTSATELEHQESDFSGPSSPNRIFASSPHPSVPSSPSRAPSQKKPRLSATGSYGYVSPEQAMAGGLTNNANDEEEEEG
ncbi:hypothetical protein MMC32_002035, partial [Xylographa parallela]|nr:hypothetical protein [Xylographa parallela]